MSATPPLYDLILLLDTAAEDARRAEILKAAEDAIAQAGEIVNKQDWGPRQMAFEIRHKKDADYHLVQFHATPELLATLERTLRITDEVVRFRIIKLAPGTPPPPEQRPEPTADATEDPAAAAEPQVEQPAYEPAPAGAFGEDDA
jgi:small subunit ribosomal protein S6